MPDLTPADLAHPVPNIAMQVRRFELRNVDKELQAIEMLIEILGELSPKARSRALSFTLSWIDRNRR